MSEYDLCVKCKVYMYMYSMYMYMYTCDGLPVELLSLRLS